MGQILPLGPTSHERQFSGWKLTQWDNAKYLPYPIFSNEVFTWLDAHGERKIHLWRTLRKAWAKVRIGECTWHNSVLKSERHGQIQDTALLKRDLGILLFQTSKLVLNYNREFLWSRKSHSEASYSVICDWGGTFPLFLASYWVETERNPIWFFSLRTIKAYESLCQEKGLTLCA